MVDLKELQSKLFKHKVYTAWQFVLNTNSIISCAYFAKSVIENILSQMGVDHDSFQESMFKALSEAGSFSATEANLPSTELDIVGIKVDALFLLDMLIKDVFQYCRNSFDSMSQISNAALLANNSKKVDSVDFPKMHSTFSQQTYSIEFPDMNTWYQSIGASPEFEYIDAFCNRTKHTLDVFSKVAMEIFGGKREALINPFYRKESQLDKKDILQYLTEIIEFTNKSFESFLSIIEVECEKDTFNGNRYHKLNVIQYKMKDYEHSFVYIEDNRPVASLPDTILVLLVNKYNDGDIIAKNAPMDRILIRTSETKQDFSCRYIAESDVGEDKMLLYRKYVKDSTVTGVPMLFEEFQKPPVYYHANPFLDIESIADEENTDFLSRVQIPF